MVWLPGVVLEMAGNLRSGTDSRPAPRAGPCRPQVGFLFRHTVQIRTLSPGVARALSEHSLSLPLSPPTLRPVGGPQGVTRETRGNKAESTDKNRRWELIQDTVFVLTGMKDRGKFEHRRLRDHSLA